MSKGARYVVTTHWGTFSLDEGSYQDYLAGKLWISWVPGAKNQSKECHPDMDAVPPHTSEKALELRDAADKRGVWNTLASMAMSSDPQIFAESIFPQAFNIAAQDSYIESQETYTSLFEDQSKYNAIMHTLAEMLYREMRQPGDKK